MKKTILSLLLLLFFFSFENLNAQETPPVENEKYRIEKVYPNPVQDQLFIEIFSEDFSFVQFELIDILGNKVKQWKKRELFPGSQKLGIDLQSIHPGFYLLKSTIEGQVVVKRIRKV